MNRYLKSALFGGACAMALATSAFAGNFNIPNGDLETALDAFSAQTGIELIVSGDAVNGARTKGAKGMLTANEALTRILTGTGFVMQQRPSGAIAIVHGAAQAPSSRVEQVTEASPVRVAAASAIESVVVTSSKIKGDIQTVPIAITALSQEQLTSRQIAGGPDLVKEVPNLTFSKTNFTGYNIQIRGIGTQAISVTTDPAVAVAFNDTPFIRNHFFEQEFYDLSQAEVLRGPQGTLYGRNATAGVVNLVSAKPTDQFEAMASADIGNYHNRRFEGMINVPIVDDRLDIRAAAEWTKRDGYSFNEVTGAPIDGRDLWSSRVTIGWKPFQDVQAYLVWEHFSENDGRLRSGKQLCKTAQSPAKVNGVPVTAVLGQNRVIDPNGYLNQGCVPTSFYSPDAFEVPNGNSIAYYNGLAQIGAPIQGGYYNSWDPYAGTTQSQNLRVIESSVNPIYKAKNDTLELNGDYNFSPSLTFTSQTGYNQDFLWSAEDYNRFNTRPGAFAYCDPSGVGCDGLSPNSLGQLTRDPSGLGHCQNTYSTQCANVPPGAQCTPPSPGVNDFGACEADGVFCDPQIGCSDRLVAEDLSEEHSWQFSQEFRLASNFSGPLNFSVGGNYLHYETNENYYVFINTITLVSASMNPSGGDFADTPWVPGVSDNHDCLKGGFVDSNPKAPSDPQGSGCVYIDPNPITSVNNEGHNYFLSQNPYVLNSYAGFGEVYYNVTDDVKLTGGLRWTSDQKHFIDIPSEIFVRGYGYASTGVVDQQWEKLTGRAVANWTPKLDFTDQTLLYASYSHGYKGGGANPPGAVLLVNRGGDISNPIHPVTFRPEFVDAYELGSKNTLLDGALTLNGDVFYYNYKDYQISEIVDRTSINLNFNATVRGAELESTWEPAPGLKFTFAGGYENATLNNGDQAVDLMDRTAGNPNWIVIKPFVTQASNCILPTYVVGEMLLLDSTRVSTACGVAYSNNTQNIDPLTNLPYVKSPSVWCDNLGGGCITNDPISGYAGFDPRTAPNGGQGFNKDLGGNQLPNAPHFTTSLSAEYTMPVSADWAATLHSDFYWQSQSFARVFNDRPYDKIRGYSNVNLALILTGASGWQVMGYLKNMFDTTAITGAFLNSDDTALTTNVFLTDPRLYGVRVTKNF
ncbi:MAG TPA: TonB-dependent receptor [Rhizomicrobium sp.]|nr:TonB-dependent receptor [Rhizomicrobium sp.]